MSVTQTKDADFVADHSPSSHDVMLTDPWQSFDNNTEQMYLKKIFMRYYCSFILLLFFKFFNYSGWTSIFYLQLLQSRVPQLLNAPKHSQLTMPSKDLLLFIPKQVTPPTQSSNVRPLSKHLLQYSLLLLWMISFGSSRSNNGCPLQRNSCCNV